MLDFLSSTTENSPKVFGFVHFLVLGIFIALIIAICVFLRKTSDKQNKIILLFFGFWLLLFEILKQIVLIYGIEKLVKLIANKVSKSKYDADYDYFRK